ncbi:hypothetical protein B566_EDAN009682 [Ephemera danica]|nr:hypothetical protein B566_EDAN009682 [Ephemera danica]
MEEMYYGGEGLTVEQPQAFTCPYCGRQGLTENTLQEHVASEHADTSFEVVCPVCASLPGGDPNHVTDDFAGHLTLEHRSGPRDLISSSGGLSSLSPSSRDVDPIAELLSQLSGVRRSAAAAAAAAVTGAASSGSSSSVSSTPSQLQQLQMQLQLERHQVRWEQDQFMGVIVKKQHSCFHMAEVKVCVSLNKSRHEKINAARQQLERLPRRQAQAASGSGSGGSGVGVGLPASASNPLANMGAVGSSVSGQGGSTEQGAGGNASGQAHAAQGGSQFLLARSLESPISESDLQAAEQERAERSLFVQELVLSALTESSSDLSPASIANLAEAPRAPAPAIPVVPAAAQQNVNRAQNHSSTANHSTSNPAPPPAVPQQHQQQQQQQQPKRSTSRGSLSKQAMPSSSATASVTPILRPPMLSPQQPSMRVVTGTGTIREVAPQPPPPIQSGMGVVPRNPPGGGGSGVVRGASPPSNATRRKPTRPIEGRNQATEPPPPH